MVALLLVLWTLLVPAANAARVRVTATVRPDLQTIAGEIVVQGDRVRLVDVQSMLPLPQDDRQMRRTFPNFEEKGWTHFSEIGPKRYAFHTILPRRYGAAGKVPGEGLFVNGPWLPQPVSGASLAEVEWSVELTLPQDTVGVLNGTIGSRTLTWSGRSQRLSLAVIPKAHTEVLEVVAGRVVVVSRHRVSKRFRQRLTEVILDSWPGPMAPDLVVVMSPLHRRLFRPGHRVLYLSDRTFRVTDGLWRYHISAVRRGILEAGLHTIEDPFARSFTAVALADALAAQPDALDILRWASWIPQVDQLLYSGAMPYYADIFDEVHPGDPVQDDLAELFGDPEATRAVTRRVDAQFGAGTSERIAARVLAGDELDVACRIAGVPPHLLTEWRKAPPEQDLSLRVERQADGHGYTVIAKRVVPVDAPPTPVPIQIGDERVTWITSRGPDEERWELDRRPKLVRIDPDGILDQTRLDNDRWPRRWTATLSAFPYEITLRRGRISAYADIALRRRYDTRWLYGLTAQTNPENIVASTATVVHYLGPLQDRRSRPFRLWASAGPALLDPGFRPTDEGAVAIDASMGAAWDTRVEEELPTDGSRIQVVANGGALPGTSERWGALSLTAKTLVPITGRITAAGKMGAGIAEGGVEHRLLSLGGSGNVQALAAQTALGDTKLVGGVEGRFAVLRHASIPMPLMWLSDVQLSAGFEAGQVTTQEVTYQAAGWTAGAFFLADVLGAQPEGMGLWVASPVYWEPELLVGESLPLELYLRFDQAF